MRTGEGKDRNKHRKTLQMLIVVMLSLLMVLTEMATIGFHAVFAAEDEPEVDADAAIVISGSTGELIYDFHSERKMSFSGVEKLMLAMVVLDNIDSEKDLKKEVTVIKKAAQRGNLFSTNEKVPMEDLLYAMLLTNSPEAAIALANHVFGSTEGCVNQMNAKAQKMRLLETRFKNVSGKYDSEQYTTARNASEITREALSYDMIAKIMSARTYTLHKTDKHDARPIESNNPLFSGAHRFDGAYAGLVSKTYADSPVSTYIGTAYVDDMNIIVIMMHERDSSAGRDANELFTYGYDKVTKKVIVDKGVQKGITKVRCGEITRVPVYTARKGYVYVPPEGSDELVTTEVVLRHGVRAPLKKGDKVGDFVIYVAGERKGSVDLVVDEDVAVGWPPSYLYVSNRAAVVLAWIFGGVLIVLLLTLLSRWRRRRRREKRRKERIRQEALRQQAIEDDRVSRNWTYR